MSIDKSLRRKNQLARSRNVLTRAERVKVLMEEERWKEGQSPFGLIKVRVHKVVIKKVKKAKEETAEGAEGAPAAAGAAPAAPAGKGAAAAPAKGAAPAAKGTAPAAKGAAPAAKAAPAKKEEKKK